ncbi:MAG TPA: hypothetical protein VF146_04660, partial [Bryobacteraceae bacterium]
RVLRRALLARFGGGPREVRAGGRGASDWGGACARDVGYRPAGGSGNPCAGRAGVLRWGR